MSSSRAARWLNLLALLGCLVLANFAQAAESDPQIKARQLWQLLDYLAVDYGGAVRDGKVISVSEYAEMQEFALAAQHQLDELPTTAAKAGMLQRAARLRSAVAAKADPAAVAQLAHGLADEVGKAYPFPMAPTAVPDLQRGAALYAQQCAACHGASGHGDGPFAARLEPPPTDLTDHERAAQRTPFALHQIISNGVQGTAMASYATLPEADRWALAFFAGTLAYSDADKAAGARLWQPGSPARQAVPDLLALTQLSQQVLAQRLGDAVAAREVTAYLRANPALLEAAPQERTAIAKRKLGQSVEAVRAGDRAEARKLALSAYLDGFEPIEPALAARDHALFEKIEAGMMAFRAEVQSGSLEQVQASAEQLLTLLNQADTALAPSQSDAWAAFVGAFTILVREGLEALLVVVAMIAFLQKAQRRDVLVYVHAGWIGALAAGGATWFAATYLVSISGASRELTEGLSSLFAAVVLLGVGMWMHRKSVAGRWQTYLQQKMTSALTRRTAWFLFSLAFIAVYREVFETVLFYAALWTDGNGWALLAGLISGIVVLGIVTAVLLRTSARLPIGKFFAASSVLIAVLAMVLAGKGVAALQEAGWVHATLVAFPRIDLLGLFPTWQTLLAQGAVLALVLIGYFANTRPMASDQPIDAAPT
jgi:high-affinity iron transporter